MWPLPQSVGIEEMGAIYTDREMMDFFDYMYTLLQDGVITYRYVSRDVSSTFSKVSDHVGGPSAKRSPQQSSFRRDLTIICEAEDMMKYQAVYDCLVKAIERVFNIKYTLDIRALKDVIPDLKSD